MRKLLGIIAFVLGVVGVLGCVAGLILVWPTSARFFQRADEAITRADETVATVQERVSPVDERLRQTRYGVAQLRAEAAKVASGGELDPSAQGKVDDILTTLDQQLIKAEDIGERLQGAAMTLRDLANTLAAFARDPDEAEKLHAVVARLDALIADVRSAIARLGTLRRTEDLTNAAQGVLDVLDVLEPPLAAMTDRVSEISGSLTETREELSELDQTVDRWRWLTPAIISVLLVWMGIGQWCLAGRGRMLLRT